MQAARQAIEDYFVACEIPVETRIDFENGFTIWRGDFRQTIWFDKPFVDQGVTLSRLNARIDLYKGFSATPDQVKLVGDIMQVSALCGPVRNPEDDSRIQLASSVYIHEGSSPNVSNLFSIMALCQVADAHNFAQSFSATGLEVDSSTNPIELSSTKSGEDYEALIMFIRQPGEARSRFEGAEMQAVIDSATTPPVVLANGDDKGATIEFPYLGQTSLATFRSDISHPVYLSCLAAMLKVRDSDATIMKALELNERECRENTMINFMGSWRGHQPGILSFSIYVPNAFYKPGLAAHIIYPCVLLHAHWLACTVEGDDWANGGFERAYENKMRMLGALGQAIKPKKKGLFKKLFGK